MAGSETLDVYNIKEVATLLGVSRNTVTHLVKTGRLGSFLVGTRHRITRGALDAYIAENSPGQGTTRL